MNKVAIALAVALMSRPVAAFAQPKSSDAASPREKVVLSYFHAEEWVNRDELGILLSAGVLATRQSPASIVGTWKVVKYEDQGADGTISYPYGEHPAGYFVYDATGHLSVHIMRTPALTTFPGMREGTGDVALYRDAFLAYAAYFGTYTVDATKGTVTHHVEGSLRPDYTGTDQVRPFRIEGDRLIIEIRQGQQYLRRELTRVK